MERSLFLVSIIAVTALATEAARGHDDHGHHVSEVNDVRIVHSWTNATQSSSALIFMDIDNTHEHSVDLTGARSDVADGATIVAFENAGGQLRYTEIERVSIAPETKMVLVPNGLALKLTGLSSPLIEGDILTITVEFSTFDIETVVEVEAASATQHSHAGHAH